MGRHINLLKVATGRAKLHNSPSRAIQKGLTKTKQTMNKTKTKQTVKKTRDAKKLNKYFDRNRVKRCTLKLSSEEKYSCQMSLLIILKARSFDTLRIVEVDDAEKSIKVDHQRWNISIHDFFRGGIYLPIGPTDLARLEECFVTALSALHRSRISYPISAAVVRYTSPSAFQLQEDSSSLRLYLPYNKKATWASDKLSPTWQADQLSHARCLFRIPLLLERCAKSQGPLVLGLKDQQDLATYIKELGPASHHVDLLVNTVSPMTVQLASEIILHLAKKKKLQITRVFFESLFGPRKPLLGATPDTVFDDYLLRWQQHYYNKRHERGPVSTVDEELEEEALRFEPATLAVFICCRAEVALIAEDDDKAQWWEMAKRITDAFGPKALDAICPDVSDSDSDGSDI